ncbi:MAG: hypothetical protein ABIP06_09735 [Pyrinomonadaceae bacterium]
MMVGLAILAFIAIYSVSEEKSVDNRIAETCRGIFVLFLFSGIVSIIFSRFSDKWEKVFLSTYFLLCGILVIVPLYKKSIKEPALEDSRTYKSLTCSSNGQCWDAEKQQFVYPNNLNINSNR